MKKVLTYFTFLVLLLLFSCNNDDETTPPVDLYNVDIGSYELLPESITAYAYTGKSQVQFVDSVGNEMVFAIQEQQQINDFGASTLFKYDVYDIGDTVRYEYQNQSLRSWLNNDSLSLDFSISLSARPYYEDPESETVADVFNILMQGYEAFGNPPVPFSVFYHVFNQRTWLTGFEANENFSTINLLGRDFSNVWHSQFVDNYTDLYFNTEFGIIYFTDHDGKAWRFDQFIE